MSSKQDLANEELIDELEGQRHFASHDYRFWIISIIAFLWSAYQLYVVYSPINSTMVRSTHLAFALLLAFLIYPVIKKPQFLKKINWYDIVLAIVGSLATLYILIDYAGLSERPGAYITRDILIAIVGTMLLLEASRRVLGVALAIIAIVFLGYDYFGPLMPELISHKGASITKLSGQMYLTTEGIFGVPLGVSAGFVFLFVLFGALLDKAGAGEYFIKLAYALLGKYRGGPAKASVVASGMTGLISGSSTANVVTTGTFTIPLMKRVGLSGVKAGAVECASSTNGQLMPPIMGAAAFIIAEFLGLDYVYVMMAAIVPAAVSYFALFYIVHLESVKLGLRGESKENLPPKFKTFISGIHYFIPVIYLIYVLVVLEQSAQSAAFSAVLMTMFIIVIQKPMKELLAKRHISIYSIYSGFSDIFYGMVSAAKNMVPIALATAVAGIIVGSVTLTGIGQVLIEVIEEISNGNIMLILLLTAFVSLLLGMGLPTTANYIVMASLTAPVILTLAHDGGYLIPAIAAHLFVFYFGILADVTPPVALAAYAASAISKSDPFKTGLQAFTYEMRTAILPFMFFFNNSLLLIQGVNPDDPSNPAGWIWITNPFDIVVIVITATLGMFAFASFSQGYFIKKLTLLERILFLIPVPLFFLPNLVIERLGFSSIYYSYLIGIGMYLLIYLMQKSRKDNKA